MKRLLPVLIVLLASIPAVLPLFRSGYFPMHDDTQVARVIEMGRALIAGQFPVRWVADLGYGYGYPIFNFYGPLPYYFGGTLYALGIPAIAATKLMFIVGVIASSIAMYLVVASFAGWQAGLLSSTLYLYAPYHAVQIYVRGAVGEYWILLFWPLILWALRGKHTVLGAIAIAGAILSHTLMGYITVLVLLMGLAFQPLLLGLGLSAFFWLPALFEMGYTSVAGQVSATANYLDHFACLGQLWSSAWGFAGSATGCVDGMSFMLGKAHILLFIGSIAGWLIARPKAGKSLIAPGVLLGIFGVYLVTPFSQPVWEILPGFSYLQYPWRFLSVAGLGLAIIGGIGITLLKNQTFKSIATIIVTAFVIIMNMKWFAPQYMYAVSSREFEDPNDLRWRVSKISDEYLPVDVPRPKDASQIVFDTIPTTNSIAVMTRKKTATEERFMVTATGSGEIVIQKAYFPGWRYWINDKEVYPVIRRGLPVLGIEAGQSVIDMRFTDTPIRRLGNLISFVTLIALGVAYDKHKKAKR